MSWILAGLLGTFLFGLVVSLSEGKIMITPLTIVLSLLSIICGWVTLILSLIVGVIFLCEYKPSVDWFNKPFKVINLKKKDKE